MYDSFFNYVDNVADLKNNFTKPDKHVCVAKNLTDGVQTKIPDEYCHKLMQYAMKNPSKLLIK